MEKQLVSFGNYLLKTVGAKGYDVDGKPVFEREVTDADLTNWQYECPQKSWELVLPSRFQIGNTVELDFFDNGVIKKCHVIKVHFTQDKVLYDVEIDMASVNARTRLYNVDSAFVGEPRV